MPAQVHSRALTVWLCLTLSSSTSAAEPPTLTSSQLTTLTSSQLTTLQGPNRDRFLASHNAARKPLNLDPLTWSDSLAAHALESLQQQQDSLIRAAIAGWSTFDIPLPTHRTDSPHGENIAAWAGPQTRTADHAVTLWLREKPAFDLLNSLGTYRVGDEQKPPASPTADATDRSRIRQNSDPTKLPPDSLPTLPPEKPPPIIVGHYTQIIWRATTHLGAAHLTFTLTDADSTTRTYTLLISNYHPPGNRLGQKPY